MSDIVVIEIYRGSAADLSFVWPDGAGLPLDLTGWTLDLFEVSARLDGHVAISSPEPAAGRVLIEIDAIADLPIRTAINTFRVRATPPSGALDAITLPLFVLVAK